MIGTWSIQRRNQRAAGFAGTVSWGKTRVLRRRCGVVVQRTVEVITMGDVVGIAVLVEGREGLSKELALDFLSDFLYRFETKYPLFSVLFIIEFRKASSDRLFIIAGTPLAMEL
jgi:hypothetical protein